MLYPLSSACVCAKLVQLCPTLCNLMDCSPPGSSVPGDSPGKKTGLGCHTLLHGIFPTQGSNPGFPHFRWILYHLATREAHEYWGGQPFPSSGDLPNPGIKTRSLAFQVDSLPGKPPGKPKSTGVVSLSLLQWIFLTQKSNQGLLHCRHIL